MRYPHNCQVAFSPSRRVASSEVTEALQNVIRIQSTSEAFAAIPRRPRVGKAVHKDGGNIHAVSTATLPVLSCLRALRPEPAAGALVRRRHGGRAYPHRRH